MWFTILSFVKRIPLLLWVCFAMGSALLFYKLQADHYRNASITALERADSAEEALQRGRAREASLKALRTLHIEKDAEIEKQIDSREYFNSN